MTNNFIEEKAKILQFLDEERCARDTVLLLKNMHHSITHDKSFLLELIDRDYEILEYLIEYIDHSFANDKELIIKAITKNGNLWEDYHEAFMIDIEEDHDLLRAALTAEHNRMDYRYIASCIPNEEMAQDFADLCESLLY